MPPEAGFVDATHKLRTAAPPPGETAEQRRERLEALIELRLEQYRARLADVRITTEAFEGYRPLGRDIDLGSIAFTAKKGQEFSARGQVAPLYPEKMRVLTESEIATRMSEALAGLRWSLLHE